MSVVYSRTLEISVEANSQREAETFLRTPLTKLKSFAKAFDLEYEISSGTRSSDNRLLRYVYIFTIQVKSLTKYGSVLRIADIIQVFAHFNAFEVGEEELYTLEDEE